MASSSLASPKNFSNLPDFASSSNGGQIIFATDDFFAPAENLISPQPPLWDPLKFTEFGKWMDGWETRRKRVAGHDWCIVKLGCACKGLGVEIDTAFFTGNFAPKISIQGAYLSQDLPQKQPRINVMGTGASPPQLAFFESQTREWPHLLARTPLQAGVESSRHHFFELKTREACPEIPPLVTHIRINLFPDGGVARLRFHGAVFFDPLKAAVFPNTRHLFDLADLFHGAISLGCSDAHFGAPQNLCNRFPAPNMASGWETARKPHRPPIYQLNAAGQVDLPGCDWAILQLACRGTIQKVIVDTSHFKGNYPESFLLHACDISTKASHENIAAVTQDTIAGEKIRWVQILERTKLGPHAKHEFSLPENLSRSEFSHIKLTIIPDGGISRLRILGIPSVMAQDQTKAVKRKL